MNEIIILILKLLLPSIAELISAFATRIAAKSPPPDLGSHVLNIVSGIESSHPDWTGDTKRAFAVDAVALHATKAGLSLTRSQVNTLVELAVQSLPS